MPKLKERWAKDRKVKTLEGEVTVTVPSDQEEDEGDSKFRTQRPPMYGNHFKCKLNLLK